MSLDRIQLCKKLMRSKVMKILIEVNIYLSIIEPSVVTGNVSRPKIIAMLMDDTGCQVGCLNSVKELTHF